MKSKTYLISVIAGTLACLIGFAAINIYIDPLFHYHGRNPKYQYPLWDERYMNDGMVRHFDYDAIITGTSMTENFKSSLFDSMWGTNSIKVPFSGATYKETADLINKGFECNPDLSYVFRSLDASMLIRDKDELDYEDYPDFLYDKNVFNDVKYVLNKEIFFTFTEYVHTFMSLGGTDTDFDTYKNWAGMYEYGPEAVFEKYNRQEQKEEVYELSNADIKKISENVTQNVIDIAVEHPETEFYVFIPPYSVCYFDNLKRTGDLDKNIEAWRLETSLLVPYENIHLYCYFDRTDIVCDLNNFMDTAHYGQDISDLLVDYMANDVGLLTKDNYDEYFDRLSETYNNLNYDEYIW